MPYVDVYLLELEACWWLWIPVDVERHRRSRETVHLSRELVHTSGGCCISAGGHSRFGRVRLERDVRSYYAGKEDRNEEERTRAG